MSIAAWVLVLCTGVGCVSIPMRSSEACEAAVRNAKWPTYATCVNTVTGDLGRWGR